MQKTRTLKLVLFSTWNVCLAGFAVCLVQWLVYTVAPPGGGDHKYFFPFLPFPLCHALSFGKVGLDNFNDSALHCCVCHSMHSRARPYIYPFNILVRTLFEGKLFFLYISLRTHIHSAYCYTYMSSLSQRLVKWQSDLTTGHLAEKLYVSLRTYFCKPCTRQEGIQNGVGLIALQL